MEFFEENNEFEDFLEDQYAENKNAECVLDEAKVNYYISRIKKNNEMKQAIIDKAKVILEDYQDKVGIWKEKKIRALDNDSSFYLERLQTYYNANAKNNKTKLHFPEGNLGYYKTRSSIKFDEPMIMEYIDMIRLRDNNPGAYSEFIKTVPKLDTKKLKEFAEIDPETNLFKIDGVAIPGVRVIPSSEEFNVR